VEEADEREQLHFFPVAVVDTQQGIISAILELSSITMEREEPPQLLEDQGERIVASLQQQPILLQIALPWLEEVEELEEPPPPIKSAGQEEDRMEITEN
jgi:hypothetical protein